MNLLEAANKIPDAANIYLTRWGLNLEELNRIFYYFSKILLTIDETERMNMLMAGGMGLAVGALIGLYRTSLQAARLRELFVWPAVGFCAGAAIPFISGSQD